MDVGGLRRGTLQSAISDSLPPLDEHTAPFFGLGRWHVLTSLVFCSRTITGAASHSCGDVRT